jgi:hypothetical protein
MKVVLGFNILCEIALAPWTEDWDLEIVSKDCHKTSETETF